MIFRFGAFELSPVSGELRKHGILVRLSPQPFQILTTLIEHPGELVSRDALQQRIWGQDQTSVEFDAGLNRCIRQIRAALSDDADAPRYIETVPRRGYRFIAPVEAVSAAVPEPEVAPAAPVPAPSRPRRKLAMIAVSAVAATMVLVIWLASTRSHLSSNLNSVPLAVALGDQLSPTFSPDGRQVAFVWNGEHQDNFDIYLKLIGSSSVPLRLTNNPDMDYSPAWSPDGRWIAFCRGTESYGGAILIIPALGGAERKVVDLHSVGSFANHSIGWSRDSTMLVVADALAGKTQAGLHAVNVETGETRQITTSAPSEEDMHPAVSPDGQTIAFTRDIGRGVSSIMVVPFAGSAKPQALAAPIVGTESRNFYNAHPAWTPDSSHIVFASNAGGNQHLWLVPARGPGAAQELRGIGSGAQEAAISRTGQLAFMHQTLDSNIWKIDLESKLAVQIAASTRLEQTPAVSPDGTRMAFESNVSGFSEIWTSRADGSNPAQVTSLQNPVTGSPDWAPDGRRLLFDSRASGRPQIYSIDANGGNAKQLTFGDASSVMPRWAPDGKSFYYSSDQTGRMEIWRRTMSGASGGSPRQVTFEGGSAPMLSRDGERVYYRASNPSSGSLWELELATGKRTLVSSSVESRAYAAADKGVYFFASFLANGDSPNKDALYFYDKQSQQKTLIYQSEKRAGLGMMLAPDGRSLYYTQLDQSGHELFLIKEFWK